MYTGNKNKPIITKEVAIKTIIVTEWVNIKLILLFFNKIVIFLSSFKTFELSNLEYKINPIKKPKNNKIKINLIYILLFLRLVLILNIISPLNYIEKILKI